MAAALGDEHEQSPAGAVIFLVGLKMLCELRDALGKDGDLNLWAAGIRIVRLKFIDDFGFFLGLPTRSCGTPASCFSRVLSTRKNSIAPDGRQ